MSIQTDRTAAHAPFLDGFAAIHQAMRRDARRLPLAVAAVESHPDAARVERWYAAFHAAIDHHHRREDELVWPELQRRDETFAAHVDELADDHRALDAALADVAAGLRDLAAGHLDRRSEVIGATEVLCAILHDHLDREEAAAFDRIGRVYSADEYMALEAQMVEGLSIGELAFVGPWTFDGLDARTVAELLASVPAPLRVLVRTVFTRRYRRIAAPLRAVAS